LQTPVLAILLLVSSCPTCHAQDHIVVANIVAVVVIAYRQLTMLVEVNVTNAVVVVFVVFVVVVVAKASQGGWCLSRTAIETYESGGKQNITLELS
jgi:hypothetical protein